MYSRHRFPDEIMSHCVWLYYTFPLSYRDIEKMMLYREIEVTYETIREWCQKFGQQYANQLRRKRPYITDKWHLDEVVVTIKKQHDGLRAVSVSWDDTLIVWNLQEGTRIAEFTGESRLLACTILPDGKTIVAGERSGRIHFLKLEGLHDGDDDSPHAES